MLLYVDVKRSDANRPDASPAGDLSRLTPADAKRLLAAQAAARADSEREALVQSILDYVERERASARRLAEQSGLLELAPDPIFVRDVNQRITFWNAAAEAVYGFSTEEAIGARAGDLLRSEYPAPLEEIERIVARDGVWIGDLIQTTKDGRRLVMESRWGAVHDENGQLSALLEINRDITDRLEAQAEREHARALLERERMSERLVRAQRLESLGQMAGGIAHDFNNLLAVVLGYASIAHRHLARLGPGAEAAAVASLREDLQEITGAAERAGELTRQLLAFARQDTVSPRLIAVNATISEMFGLLRRTLGTHIELETRLAPDLDPVRIDPGQLSQILVNLAVNSRAAMPRGGRLTIETSVTTFRQPHPLSHGEVAPGRYVRLRVNDTGSGMPREVVERAFDPFYTTKPVGEGTGLGLATVYGITTQAGGQVELYSEVGRGTTVTLVFPAAPSEGEPPASGTAAPPPPVVTGARILVVDDQPSLRRVIVEVLREAGYAVLEAGGGAEALQVMQSSQAPVDLLLTDVVMPGMLGQQLADRLRLDHPRCPVVFMSGFAHPLGEAAGDAEANLPGPLLQKPFSESELLAVVAEQITRARRSDPARPASP
jgi:two-component system cell cycle sensor histidine kinase/response regulator CckA